MKAGYFVFCFLLTALHLSTFSGQASEPEDSLLSVLKKSKEDSIKVSVLNDLFSNMEFTDSKRAKDYLKQALDLSVKIQYLAGMAQTYTNMGYLAEDNGNYP
jgi:hypothetical protein